MEDFARVAQSVEHVTENHGVDSSILSPSTEQREPIGSRFSYPPTLVGFHGITLHWMA